jgi:hypothetical protein
MRRAPLKLYSFNPLTTADRRNIDRLIGNALIDTQVRHRLLVYRDESLLVDFELDEPARRWLLGINATSLDELARVICAAS